MRIKFKSFKPIFDYLLEKITTLSQNCYWRKIMSKTIQGRILNCLIRLPWASHPSCHLHYSGSSWEEVTPVWGQLNLAINLPYSDFWTRRRWGKYSGKLFESVFEEVIVIICLSVSVGGRKHKRLTSFYYPVIIVFLCFKRCTIFRL